MEIGVLGVLRGCWRLSEHLDMSRSSVLSLTYLQQVVRFVLVEFVERHDKWTGRQHYCS